VARTAERVFMPLTVGGGVRQLADIRALLNAGADKVSINTAAVERPEVVEEAALRFGSQCIVVAIDAKRVVPPAGDPANARTASSGATSPPSPSFDPPRFEVFTHGGRRPTGIDAVEWAARMERSGAGEILLTSMDRDGTQEGYDIALTRAVSDMVQIPVIASGGVGTLEHLYEGLAQGGASAVLAASIFHYGTFSVRECKEYLRARGVPVRL